jgi:DNA repair protein SbcD/Mre11
LRSCVDYLALGHVHKPYEFEGWMYNPGSTETCGAEEAQWDDRGYYYVEIDSDLPERIIDLERKERIHHAEHLKSKRRPFVRHNMRIDGLTQPDLLYDRLEDYCRRDGVFYQGAEVQPLVLVQLTGTLSFDAGALDIPRMEEMVRNHFQALYVRVDNNTNDQDYVPDDSEFDGSNRSLWHELERRIFEELVARDSRYLPAKEQWSAVVAELKLKALEKDEPERIAQLLREKRAELFQL